MGYYTQYSFEVKFTDGTSDEEVIADLRDTNDNAEYAINADGSTKEECKWYDHVAELKEFSKRYPSAVLALAGEGEEGGDLWVKYFRNGKCQKCPAQIVYSPFNPDKLR